MIRPLRDRRIVPALLPALAAIALLAFARAPASVQEAPDEVKSLVGTYRGDWKLFGVDNTGKVVPRATWTDVMVAQSPTIEAGRAFVKTMDEMTFTGLGGKKQWPGSEGYLLKADGSLGDYFIATGDQITRGQKIADNVWTYVSDVSTAELQSLGFPAEATGSHVMVKVVATEQAHVLQQTPTLKANIKKICIKHEDKVRNAPSALFTIDEDELLNDSDINVIVELIDDADAAYRIVTAAFRKKKAVVSANKKMIAEHLAEMLHLQREHGVSFLYEAAVCGSVPVIRNLEEYYDNDLLSSFSGIINGSTNFILTKMNEEGLNYKDALGEAQELGFAESDPSLDVEGGDAVNKLTIVLQHAYGITCLPETILRQGITDLHEADSRFADEKGYKIKLVAQAKLWDNNQITAFVLPTFVTENSLLFNIRNEYNGALIGSKLADEQFLYGKGAGRFPTSSAVLSDIAALRYGYRYEYKKTGTVTQYHLSLNKIIKVFVSYNREGDISENDFVEIEENYISLQRRYLVGTINLETLNTSAWLRNKTVSVIIFDE